MSFNSLVLKFAIIKVLYFAIYVKEKYDIIVL